MPTQSAASGSLPRDIDVIMRVEIEETVIVATTVQELEVLDFMAVVWDVVARARPSQTRTRA
jgi:hypothetical protein